MTVKSFEIPGHATRREYAVYVMVARHRRRKRAYRLYVGKTGDNREGCNPVISRAGNHFSYNKIHSQMRNHLKPEDPPDFDFHYFYTCFGAYIDPKESREGIELINEMERQLNKLVQERLDNLMNPYKGAYHVFRKEREKRQALATPARMRKLQKLVDAVETHLDGGS
ncbi:MAG: hypothetical protein GX573_20665 [Chloroflexi bacterium]|nr:hypothetical protein [Chloroflexota bacterium]HOI37372.1 hypothetical protein [Bacillota bacterium]